MRTSAIEASRFAEELPLPSLKNPRIGRVSRTSWPLRFPFYVPPKIVIEPQPSNTRHLVTAIFELFGIHRAKNTHFPPIMNIGREGQRSSIFLLHSLRHFRRRLSPPEFIYNKFSSSKFTTRSVAFNFIPRPRFKGTPQINRINGIENLSSRSATRERGNRGEGLWNHNIKSRSSVSVAGLGSFITVRKAWIRIIKIFYSLSKVIHVQSGAKHSQLYSICAKYERDNADKRSESKASDIHNLLRAKTNSFMWLRMRTEPYTRYSPAGAFNNKSPKLPGWVHYAVHLSDVNAKVGPKVRARRCRDENRNQGKN